jgi:hypothetical protein
MKGSLKVFNRLNKQTSYLSYNTLSQLNDGERKIKLKELYNLYSRKQLHLRCTCKENGAEMSIGYREPTYYLRSYNNQLDMHDNSCYFSKESSLSSSNSSNIQSGIITDESGNFMIKLNPHDYKINKVYIEPTNSSSSNTLTENKPSSNKTTINQLVKFIVTNSWNNCIQHDISRKEFEYPTISDVFKKAYSYVTKKVFITKSITLHDVLFKQGKIGAIYHIENKYKNKAQPFILFKLIQLIELPDYNKMKLIVENPITHIKYEFNASTSLFEYAKRNVIVSDGPLLVAGFVKNIGFKEIPEMISMSLIPINDWGVPIESSYERRFYNNVCENRRLIIRPIETKYYPQFKGLLPDGLFIDTNPQTVVEIFGMSKNNLDYHYHREEKIMIFSDLKPNYQFWYWDAFEDTDIPQFPL